METLEYLRSFTILGYAIIDLIASFWGIYLLSPRLIKLFLQIWIEIKTKNWMFLVLPIGILFHITFWNITPMTRDFLNINDFYFLKILIIVLVIFGLNDIKFINKKWKK